jgi:glyoxylase-like metal-dependent hydrolase (beta-lactamase superfamily II)
VPEAISREIDVLHCGVAQAICCHQVGDVLVDPGPESAHRTLLGALDGAVPRAILLTHIHFDHAGATGALVRLWPEVEVWVHERGARHLVDPERLVASARRLYGDDFDRLWGEVIPVPERNLRVLSGGETIEHWRVAYTPGHASHHVAYLDERTGAAFCGDVAGARIGDGPTIPPTPPPDIDLELWRASIDTVTAWAPTALAITHFGTFTDVAAQLDALRAGLTTWGERARELDDAAYQEAIRASWRDCASASAYDQAVPADTLWSGLDRYWSKRAEASAPAHEGG